MGDKIWRIRPARDGDLDCLTKLLTVLFAIEADFAIDEERQRRGLRLMLAAPQACVLVAEAQGSVIGMATGQLTISTAEGGPALLVEDVVVKKAWRGRGIGRGLLRGIGEWAASRGAQRLQLLADCNNVAGMDFYRQLGWQTTALICLRQRVPPCCGS
ncbi:MAG: GNAT family N-acetyltransferase [Desulfobulbaceae bacterium]|nr:GNAT family N-acetyltransferase [Desulfobulbaceae bacterium]